MLYKVLFLVALVCHQTPAELLTPILLGSADTPQERIVSGWQAQLGQHPHQAALRTLDWLGRILGCGGSVIHEEWVVTAAHCTANYRSVTVLTGLTALANAEYASESREWYNHPSYDASDVGRVQSNDIALIKLQIPMTFTPNLKRIQIQSTADAFRNYDGLQVYASGWGLLWTQGQVPTELQWVYLRAISNTECNRLFGTIINQNAICAQYFNETSQSVCQGDSGGPLVHLNEQNVPILIGVTSFVASASSGGCHSGHPGGFVRPGPFLSWFQDISGIDFENLEEPDPTTPVTLPPITTPSPNTTTPAPNTTTSSPDTTTSSPNTTTSLPNTTTPSPNTTTPLPNTTTPGYSTTTPLPTPEPPGEDDDDDDSDEELSELLKRLEVKVKVKVRLSKYRTKNGEIKETVTETIE